VQVELNRAELELQQEESALHTELSRLLVVGHELDGRLKAVRGVVAALGPVSDGALQARLAATTVPAVDPDAPFAPARGAREAAVKARRAATAAARTQLAALRQHLSAAATQLVADEQAAERLTGLARQKQRAAEEAAAASAAEAAFAQTLRPGTVPAVKVEPPPPPAAAKSRAIGRMTAPLAPGKAAHRISQRVQMHASVDLSSDNNFFNGFSSNISDGGLFVATVNLQPIGTEIDVTFTLPSGQKIAAHGQVRWVRVVDDKHPDSFPGLGIQFTRLDPQAQSAINDFVSSREPMFYAE
jgi:uncharacterized protein (TIGR02266 family)